MPFLDRFKNIKINWKVFLISVVIAFVLWFNAATEQIYEVEKTAYCFYINLPDSLIIKNKLPKKIKARFRAKGKELLKLYFGKIKIFFDISNLKEGENFLKLVPKYIKAPLGSKVNYIEFNPPSIVVSTEKIISKKVPLEIPTINFPKKGYIQTELKVLDEVYVKGPRSKIEKIKFLKTSPVNLSDMDTTFRTEVKIKSPFPDVELSRESVGVLVKIEPYEIKFLSLKVEIKKNDKQIVKISPEYVSLKIRATPTILKDLKAYIDVRNFAPGEYKLVPKLTQPVEVLSIYPKEVRVIIIEKEQ